MKRLKLLLLPFFILSAFSEAKVVTGEYYYSMPSEATLEWAYRIPDCSPVSSSKSDILKKCSKFEGHLMCDTNQTVELSNTLTKEKKKFSLVYHVFKSKSQCDKDKNSALEEE